ncbi:hypothetical protein ACWDSJ_15685 [Nocardia sp. NPDC003482]
MRSLGRTLGLAFARTAAGALLVAATALGGPAIGGVAWAHAPRQPVPAPGTVPVAAAPISVVLTTIPTGWDARTDLQPILEVRGDGRAVRSPDAASADRAPGAAPQRTNGRVPVEVLTDAAAEAHTLATADMGMPQNGDSGSTLLDFLGDTPDQDVHLVVYSPATDTGLSDEQKANRKRFADLCSRLLDSFVADQ